MNCFDTETALAEMMQYTKDLTSYVYELKDRAGDKKLEDFAIMRNMPLDIVKKSDIFYIEDAVEMLLPGYLDKVEDFGVISPTNKKPIFHNRYVMPIKDTHGNILNLVGYSKKADERYVYGTAKYYRRRETMYGLENLPLAYEMGFAILTEGITDTIRIRSLGFPNTFANCGTHKSDFIMKQLNRCKHGIIKIPDRDSAGKRAAEKWVCHRSITLNTYIAYKDVDEMCRESQDNINAVLEYLNICIDWLMSGEQNGVGNISQTVTIH